MLKHTFIQKKEHLLWRSVICKIRNRLSKILLNVDHIQQKDHIDDAGFQGRLICMMYQKRLKRKIKTKIY